MYWLAQGLRKVQVEPGVIRATENFKRNHVVFLFITLSVPGSSCQNHNKQLPVTLVQTSVTKLTNRQQKCTKNAVHINLSSAY